jgi:hypothetical protein
MLPAATSFLICAKNSFELTRYRLSWKANRSMMIVTTTAEQTRFRRRNHGFSLNAANIPVSPLLAAPCSTKRRRCILEAPFLTLRSTRYVPIRATFGGSVRDYSGVVRS